MAGTDQDGGFALQAQDSGAQPDRQADGGKNQQRIGDEGLYAKGLDLLDGQPQAIERDAETQQRLFAELQAGREDVVRTVGGQVAGDQAEQHGQGQRADAAVLQQCRRRHPERGTGQQETEADSAEQAEKQWCGTARG
ncbi:hypothetical protein D9M70_584570 [compost metagenome]